MVSASMTIQHSKWLEEGTLLDWRKPVPSLNVLLTSTCWRNDHNGFSHQGPGLIQNVITKRGEATVVRSIISGNEAGLWSESQGGGIVNRGALFPEGSARRVRAWRSGSLIRYRSCLQGRMLNITGVQPLMPSLVMPASLGYAIENPYIIPRSRVLSFGLA